MIVTRYIEDFEDAKRNRITFVGNTGANYNAVIRFKATPVDETVIEPVTLQEVKDYSHIDLNDDDAKILRLIPGVRQMVERYTGLSLIPITATAVVINGLGYITLLGSPASNILNGTETIDLADPFDETTLTYDGGYALTDVPEALKTIMLMQIDYMLNGGTGFDEMAKELLKPFQYA